MIKKTLILLLLGFIPVTTYAALQANDDRLTTGVSLPASLNVLANGTGSIQNNPMHAVAASSVHTLIFVDPAVANYQTLFEGIHSQTEIIILDPAHDGVAQITAALNERRWVGNVHILSHGKPGGLQLGRTYLHNHNLNTYRSAFEQWFALPVSAASQYSVKPDLILYGCNVAAGMLGASFVAQLSRLTGADVAASSNLTGNAALGGDWVLEIKTGTIETPIAFQPKVRNTYTSILAEITLPYSQNFDTFSLDTLNPVSFSDNWQNVSGDSTPDEWDWYVHSGSTLTSGTGPTGDHTTGSGQYLYIEDSGNDNENIILLSPSFNVAGTTTPTAYFWYHSNDREGGTTQNTLHIDIVDASGTELATDVVTIQHVDDDWHKQTVDLSAYTGNGDIRMRFRADANNGTYKHDVAIDDFEVHNTGLPDVGVVSIDAPVTGPQLTATENVVITVKNFSTVAQNNNIFVSYTINGGIPVTETLPGPVAPSATTNYTFTTTADLSIFGTYNLNAATALVDDADNSNDQATATVFSFPVISTFPYTESFEGGTSNWASSGTNSSWQVGTPADDVINSASDGNNAWVTNLTGNHNSNEQSFVLSPYFDFSGRTHPEIILDVWWESEFSYDGAALQYSTDGGASWPTVGQSSEPNNWYTDGSINGLTWASSQQGWTGNGQGWITARHELTGLGGESNVILRIAFGSDGSATGDGFAFDHVIVQETPAADVGVILIDKPLSGVRTATETVEVTIKNFGLAAQSNIPVSYTVNGGTPVTEILSGPVAPGATFTHTFTTQVNYLIEGTYNFTATTQLAGDAYTANDQVTSNIQVILDTDGDGIADRYDSAPHDANQPGTGIEGVYTTTTDNENNTGTGTPDGDMGTNECISRSAPNHPIEFNIRVDKAIPFTSAYLTVFIEDIDLPDEVDEVFLNGHSLGIATGENQVNYSTLFVIPDLSWVKLGNNLVQIQVDTLKEGWCATTRNGQIMIDIRGSVGTADIRTIGTDKTAYAYGETVTLNVEVDSTSTQTVWIESVLRDPVGTVIAFDTNPNARNWPISGTADEPYQWATTLPASGTDGLWAITTTIYDTNSNAFQTLRTVTINVPDSGAVILPVVNAISPSSSGEGKATGVSITGVNFVPSATTCKVGNVALSNQTVVNNTTVTGNVTATLPVGTYNVTCTTSAGPGTLANAFTIIPSISINNVSVSEGDTATVMVDFTVSLSSAVAQPVSVDYATINDTATAGNDYIAVSSTTLTFNPGETSKTVTISVNGDTQDEGTSEQFFVKLSNPSNVTIVNGQGIATIIDDDIAGPVVSNIQFDGASLADGSTISRPGTISLTATDLQGLSRVEFWVDGTLFHTDSNGSSQYSAFWQIMDVSDGAHTLEIKAYDTLGNTSSTVLNVSVALAPPPTPVITQPVTGLITNQSQITVTGTAEPGTEVLLYRNGTEVGSPLNLDKNNRFSGALTLLDGQNALQAAARNRGGTGPLSDSTQVTLDTNIPKTPGALRADAREGGEIRLSWQAVSGTDIVGYDVYRAAISFVTVEQAQKVNTETITGTLFDDLVSTSGQYYYRIVAVNALGTTSALSNEVSVYADAIPPRATLIEYTPALSKYTQGRVAVTLNVSEPLLTTPFLSMVPDGGIPIAIALTPITETQYKGHLDITGTTPSGTAYAVFSARDTAGNRGTEIDAGASINIDSDGPFIAKLTLSPAEPIRNEQTNPVTVQVSIELNEALPTGKVPELSYRIGSASFNLPALTQTSPLSWSASFSLPAEAGLNAPEYLQFSFRAEDDLGNVGNQIVADNNFQIYQDDLPPLAVPVGLVGIALPDGRVHLSWEAVTEATDYQLFRQAPGETELSPYQRSGGALTLTDETKPQDGLYRYAVASVRTANAQEAVSAYGNVVEATTDSVVPAAPANFQLALVGAGIRATWDAPAGNEALTYHLYRAADEIVAITDLTAIKTGITALAAIDNAPSETEHYYAVVARDAVGNESPVSDSAYLNVDLLPVATLEVVQVDENPPVLSWSHTATNLTGFDIYLGAETERVKVNATPYQNTTYTDTGYNRQERIYTVVAIDSNGVESLGRTLVLPELSVELQNTTPIRRGQFNTLNYRVTNQSSHPVTNLSLTAQLGDYAVHSQPFALTAGETKNVLVVVGGYADLADISTLVSTLAIRPESGEVTRVVRQQQVEITDGSSLTISLQSKQMTRGSQGKVKFTAENTSAVDLEIVIATAGGIAASDEVQFRLLDEDGNVLSTQSFQQTLGEHVIALANGQTVARIPAGGRFESVWIDMPVPASAPSDVKLQLTIDKIHYHLGQEDAVSIAGITSRQPVTLVDTSYYGEITNITPATSYGGEPIVIIGNAIERATSNAMPLVPLQLVINLRGFERSYQVYTDQNGGFSHTFTPLVTESGHYKVSVVHPELTERPEQGQFVIQRISLGGESDYTVSLRIPFNYEQRIDVPVTAGASAEEHNVRLVYEAVDQPLGELPAGVQVQLGNALSVLQAGERAQLSLTVTADSTADASGTLVAKILTDERGDTPIGRVVVNYQFSAAQPALFPSPSIIETGVTLDNSVTETITLENKGLGDLTGLTVALLNEDGTLPAPAWIYLTTPENLGTLAVGEKRDVQIMAYPSGSVSEGDYLFMLRAGGDNAAPTDIYVAIAVTKSGVGSRLFKVADIYTATLDDQGNVIEGLAGAKIHLQNEKVLTVDKTLITDNAGEALFSDLPAGRYKFKATAENHQEVIGRFRIKPGVTVSERVFLDYNLVTVEWSVTEITIEDRYEITLEATYETNVPAPVVILEPLSVNLPDMQLGDVHHGEFTLTNYGLIRADDLKFDLPSDQYFKYELLGNLPISLGAKERITIPYRVTALKALAQSADGSGGGCHEYFSEFKVTYIYKCADGTLRTTTGTATLFKREGECSSGGNFGLPLFGGGGGGGGGTSFCTGCGGGNQPVRTKPTPTSEMIDGVECWPIAERWEHCRDIPVGDYFKQLLIDAAVATGCSVNTVQMEFNDDATDLRVKVPGGSIQIERLFYGNAWHWLYLSNHLKFNWNTLGNYIASIDKGGVTYELSVGSSGTVWEVPANPVYVNKDNAKIIKQADGYRWQNKTGQWKEYDLNGRTTAFGNRQGTIGKLLYPATANASAIGIADRNDRQVFWFEYNQDGQLSAARDLDNRRVEYSYLGEHLTGVKDVLGQNTVYEYDSRGYLVKKIDSGSRVTLVESDSYGHPTAVTGANGDGFFFEYFYDASKKEYYSRMTTSSGKIKEVWYNKDGETKRVDINGRTVKTLDKDRRDLLITDEKGNVIRKSYDEWNNLNRVVYPDKSTASYEYEHRFNRLTRAVDRRGYVTKYHYDEYGNLVQKTEAVGTVAERVTTFTYDAQNLLLTLTVNGDSNTEAATTTFSYDRNGNIASIRDPLDNTVEFLQYDNMGNPLAVKDARGFTWRYSYDRLGRLVSQTDPLNLISAYEYNGANNNTAVVDVAQNRFEFFYNEHNQLNKAIDPFLNESRIIYNSDKLPVQLIDEAGKTGLAEYDNEARLIRSIDGAGNEIVPHYDDTKASFVSSYLPAKVEYPTYTQQLYYDKLQRLVRTTEVLDTNTRYSESYTYDAANNVVSEVDQAGETTTYEYDPLNRLVKIIDALNGVTELSYDDRNNITAVKDANNGITRYEYDQNNNLVKLSRPMGEVTQYAYDAANNQTARLDAKGQKIAYLYDALDRLTQVDYYAATDHSTPVKTVHFSYETLGNMSSYDDGTTSAVYSYDALQRKLSETVNYGSFTLGHSYEYYANSLKKAFTGPDGVKIVYEYDDNNRLSAIDIFEVGRVTYNTYQWNSPAKITLPGGSQIEWAYDPLMRLQSQVSQDAAKNKIAHADYEHSPTDNVTKKTTADGEYTYQYDEVSRLRNATHPVLENESYSYGLVGNRLTAAGVPDGASYNANNALTRYGEAAFEHDANGNLVKQTLGTEVRHYVYDIADRLIRVEDGSGNVVAEYYYDPFGRRLWKKVDWVKTYFGYADEGLIGEYGENGVETKAYGYRPGSLWTTNPLFQKNGGAYYWYQNDHLGTPQKLLDNAGNVVWAANYEAFGDAQVDVALIENNLRFPGQYYDVETGLHYNWHRYYDPISGRYLSIDPEYESTNVYVYVFNSPLVLLDPRGSHTVVNVGYAFLDTLILEPSRKIIAQHDRSLDAYFAGKQGGIITSIEMLGVTFKEVGLAGLSVFNPFTYTKATSRGIINTVVDDPEHAKQLKKQADNVNDALGILYGLKGALSNSHKASELWEGGIYHRIELAPKFGDAFLKRGNEWLFQSAALRGDALINVYLGGEWIDKNWNNIGAVQENGAPVIQKGGSPCQ